MNYLLHNIIRVRFVRTCAQNNNYNNNKENKKKVLACVLSTTNPSPFFVSFIVFLKRLYLILSYFT